MGNKQKTMKDKNDGNSNNINFNSSSNYPICPECWKRIPYIKLFIESNIPKIKINCICLPEHKNYIILNLSDYINKLNNRALNLFKCINHKNIDAKIFCFNCENWYCDNCNSNHFSKNNKECENNMNDDNCLLSYCNKDNE